MKRNILMIFLMLSLAGFVNAKRLPEWADGTSKKYKETKYLIGVGISKDLDDARSKARGEIAKVFEARVAQEAEAMEYESLEQAKGKKANIKKGIESKVKTKVETDEILQGVEIKKTFYHKKKKTYYALAVLNKRQAEETFSFQINNKEEIISSNLLQAKETDSVVDRIKYLTIALEAAYIKEALELRRRIVESSKMPGSVLDSSADIEKRRQKAMNKLVFVIGTKNRILKKVVTEKVVELGLNVEEEVSKKKGIFTVLVECDLEVKPSNREHAKLKFYSWRSEIKLLEAAKKENLIIESTKQGEVSNVNEGAARDKAILIGNKRTGEIVAKQIKKYVFNK